MALGFSLETLPFVFIPPSTEERAHAATHTVYNACKAIRPAPYCSAAVFRSFECSDRKLQVAFVAILMPSIQKNAPAKFLLDSFHFERTLITINTNVVRCRNVLRHSPLASTTFSFEGVG